LADCYDAGVECRWVDVIVIDEFDDISATIRAMGAEQIGSAFATTTQGAAREFGGASFPSV
jgi:hypothetical protein